MMPRQRDALRKANYTAASRKRAALWVYGLCAQGSGMLTLQSTVVTVYTTHFNTQNIYILPKDCICVSYDSKNKEPLYF
jgi:hypothetical protein